MEEYKVTAILQDNKCNMIFFNEDFKGQKISHQGDVRELYKTGEKMVQDHMKSMKSFVSAYNIFIWKRGGFGNWCKIQTG